MAKVVDITEKLSFDKNPKLLIKGELYEVNADAKTMLEIMAALSSGDDMKGAMAAYEKLFGEDDRKKIDDMKLQFRDLMIVIEAAMSLVQGNDSLGEAQTHTTT